MQGDTLYVIIFPLKVDFTSQGRYFLEMIKVKFQNFSLILKTMTKH